VIEREVSEEACRTFDLAWVSEPEQYRRCEPLRARNLEGGRPMMYGNNAGWGWMWGGGLLLLLILAALIVLVVRAFSSSASTKPGQKAQTSSARQIIEERLARGEITPDEFRQLARALDEHSP